MATTTKQYELKNSAFCELNALIGESSCIWGKSGARAEAVAGVWCYSVRERRQAGSGKTNSFWGRAGDFRELVSIGRESWRAQWYYGTREAGVSPEFPYNIAAPMDVCDGMSKTQFIIRNNAKVPETADNIHWWRQSREESPGWVPLFLWCWGGEDRLSTTGWNGQMWWYAETDSVPARRASVSSEYLKYCAEGLGV